MAWVERADLRRVREKIFEDDANPRIKRLVSSISDIHYHDGSAWQEINEAIEDDTLSGFAHKVDRLRHAIHIGSTGTRRWMPRRDHPSEYIEFGRLQSWNGSAWGNVNLGTPTRTGNTITWNTVAFTLILTVTWNRVKIYAVLKTEAARRRLRWAVSLSGLTYNQGDLTASADSELVGHVDLPIAWDANGSIDNQNVAITTTYSGGYIEFGGDLSAAVLPITIDPTLSIQPGSGSADTELYQGAATSNRTTNTDFHTGRDDNTFRTLLEFDASSIASGSTCNSASLVLYQINGNDMSANRAHSVYELRSGRSGWLHNQATWTVYNTGNNWTTAGAASTASDRQSTALGTGNAPTAAGDFTISLSATAVAGWFGASNTNYGIVFQNDNNADDWTYRTFASSENTTAANRPELIIDYTEASSGVTGSLSQTLAAVTSSAAGTVAVVGASAQTLAAVTLSAGGLVPRTGAAAVTLGALTSAAAGAVAVVGQSAVTLAAVTLTAGGLVPRTGAAAVTLEALTSSGAGTVAVVGSAVISLGTLTAAGVGTVAIKGTLAVTLGGLTAAGSGTVAVAGSAAITLGAVTLSAAGLVPRTGTGAITFDTVALAAAGVVGNTPILGAGAITFGAVTLNAGGTVTIAGAAAINLAGLQAAAAGQVLVQGTSGIALSALTLAAAGAAAGGVVSGQAAISLVGISVQSAGMVLVQGQAAITLGILVAIIQFIALPIGRTITPAGENRQTIIDHEDRLFEVDLESRSYRVGG